MRRIDPRVMEGRGCQPIICPANLRETLMLESILVERCACTWGRVLSQARNGQARQWPKEPENCSHISNLSYPKSKTLSLSPLLCPFHMHFASSKCFTCFPTFCLFAEFFLQRRQRSRSYVKPAGPCGLAVGIQ